MGEGTKAIHANQTWALSTALAHAPVRGCLTITQLTIEADLTTHPFYSQFHDNIAISFHPLMLRCPGNASLLSYSYQNNFTMVHL